MIKCASHIKAYLKQTKNYKKNDTIKIYKLSIAPNKNL